MIRLKVQEFAQKRGFTQGKLARAANLDPKTLRHIYQNPYANIELHTLDRLAHVLQVDPRELIEPVLKPPLP